MAKITGPLISLGARGSIGKTAVYSSWRGRGYVRQHVIPANPRSTGQVEVRTLFGWLQQAWKRAPTIVQDVWTLAAAGLPLTNRNAFTSKNVLAIGKAAVLIDNIVLSDGAKGGPPLASATGTPGATNITVAGVTPTPPTGWVVTSVQAAAVADVDPQTSTVYAITAGEDLVSPYSIVLSGLVTAQLYVWAAWIKWAKPDGTVAYSVQVSGTATPT